MKRGYSFLSEEKVGKQVFSDKFTLSDDPSRMETFPLKRDFMGKPRGFFPLFKKAFSRLSPGPRMMPMNSTKRPAAHGPPQEPGDGWR